MELIGGHLGGHVRGKRGARIKGRTNFKRGALNGLLEPGNGGER